MKSISNFGSLVKNLNEENKNIKAPLKNYTDIDLSKNDYKKERPERPERQERHERPDRQQYENKERYKERHDRPDRQERPQYENRERKERPDRSEKQEEKEVLQRPTFINTALENKPNNFRELNTQGDVIKII